MAHVSFANVEHYVRNGVYPERVKTKGEKANFRRACRKFSVASGQFLYDKTRLVVANREEQLQIIKDVHEGLGEDSRAKAMASHRGRDTTYQKVSDRFYWHNMVKMVDEYVKACGECQRHGKSLKKFAPELQSVPVPSQAMSQVGVDICQLPPVDGFRYLVVLIDYFTKWSEAKPI